MRTHRPHYIRRATLTRKPRCGPRGVTLIEVLGALVLLGTLLVGLLVAKGRLVRQLTLAEEKARAVAAADTLLTTWWQNPTLLPRASQGTINGPDQFVWRTSLISNQQAQSLGGQIVCLEILDAQEHSLVNISIILPAPPPATRANNE